MGVSGGYTFGLLMNTMSQTAAQGSGTGTGFDVTVAWDIGEDQAGCLIGLKYFSASNTVTWNDAKVNFTTTCYSIFVKYALRDKAYEIFYQAGRHLLGHGR
jgi:hypothetical protein